MVSNGRRPDSILRRMWRWRYALPQEKGGWVWWIGPLLVGVAAAPGLHRDLLGVLVAAFCAFSIRQPLILLLKGLARERDRDDVAPAAMWAILYAALLAGAAIFLLARGHAWVTGAAAAGTPLMVWHLWFVHRRREKQQALLDVLAAAVLALAGPAAYWSCGGDKQMTAFLVWFLTAIQSSASIVHIFVRLMQRRLDAMPPPRERWRMARGALLHHSANTAAGMAAASAFMLILAFAFR